MWNLCVLICPKLGTIKRHTNKFLFTPIFYCCFRIRDPGWVKIRIWDKHPGSATPYAPIFYDFSFFLLFLDLSFWLFSSFSSLFCNFFLFFSSYPSLLIYFCGHFLSKLCASPPSKHFFVLIQPLRKVELAIRGFKDCRLDDLAMMGVCSHTGCNENVNSVHNKVRTDKGWSL